MAESRKYYWLKAVPFSLISWLILVPILTPVLLLLAIYKLLVYAVMRILRPSLELLSASDAGLIDDLRKKVLYNIGVVFVLECEHSSQVRVEALRASFLDLFIESSSSDEDDEAPSDPHDGYRKLTRTYASHGGYYFWETVRDFRIEKQIAEYTIPSESELSEFVTKWLKYPYEEGGPLWGSALIKWGNPGSGDGTTKSSCAVAFRIHHAVADGLSVLQIVNRWTGTKDEPVVTPPKTLSVLTKLALTCVLPYILKEFMGKLLSAPSPMSHLKFEDDDSFHVFTSLSLDQVKCIKKELNVPFATILMTIVGGIYRHLLKEGNADLPEHVYLGMALPWPYRKPDTLGNEWTFGAFKVPVEESDVNKRLKVISEDFESYIKDGSRFVLKPFMFGLMSLIPVGLVHRLMAVNNMTKLAPMPIMSGSLAGSLQQEYRLLGCKVKHCYPIANNADPHLALGAISTSHGEQMDICILADKNLFPKTLNLEDCLLSYFRQEYQQLKECL